MGQKPRCAMPVKERAKQFAPFAAVGGLEAALAKKRQELCFRDRLLLTEEAQAEIDAKMHRLQPGMTAEVLHYVQGIYCRSRGVLRKLDISDRSLILEDEKICFENIAALEILAAEEKMAGPESLAAEKN